MPGFYGEQQVPRRNLDFARGEIYHVYNRGVARQPIFFTDANWGFFVMRLRETLTPDHAVLAYCLMPNHYHLVVRVGEGGFSEAMQRLGTSYTKAVNRQEGRVGPLFQSRFRAVHVDGEEYLLHLTRYVHRNPVEAGLVASPEEWKFSSYRDYVGLRAGTLPEAEEILMALGGPHGYAEFVCAADVDAPRGLADVLLDDELG